MCVVACVRIYAVRMFYLSHARIILFLSSFFASDCVCHTCGTILCTSAYCRAPKNSTQQLQRTPLFFLFLLFLPMRLLACLRSHTCLHCWFFAVCCRSVLPPICIDRHCCCHCLFSIFLLLLFFPCTFLGMHIINRMYVCGTCVCTHVLCLRLPSDTLYQTHLSVLWAMEIGTLAAS